MQNPLPSPLSPVGNPSITFAFPALDSGDIYGQSKDTFEVVPSPNDLGTLINLDTLDDFSWMTDYNPKSQEKQDCLSPSIDGFELSSIAPDPDIESGKIA